MRYGIWFTVCAGMARMWGGLHSNHFILRAPAGRFNGGHL